MPIYEYQCADCGFQDEYLRKVSEPPLTKCPSCGKESYRKQLSAAGFQLRGSGWYATDFKSSGAKPAEKKPEATAETKTEVKTEAKKESTTQSTTESKKTESATTN